jgi:hypothetical protein
MQNGVVNTDREIWRGCEGDYYADSIHVTKGGGIGINCNGTVIVKPVGEWHKSADTIAFLTAEVGRLRGALEHIASMPDGDTNEDIAEYWRDARWFAGDILSRAALQSTEGAGS